MKPSPLSNLARAALFAALIFLGTFIIKIPLPSGYVHFGDGFIYAAAAIMPPLFAASAAAIGGLLSDVLAGYAIYAPWTAIIKALMALPVAFICRNNRFVARMRGDTATFSAVDLLLVVLAVVISGAVNVAGYFLADTLLYSLPAAVATLAMNGVQSVAGIAVFFVSLPVLSKAFRG